MQIFFQHGSGDRESAAVDVIDQDRSRKKDGDAREIEGKLWALRRGWGSADHPPACTLARKSTVWKSRTTRVMSSSCAPPVGWPDQRESSSINLSENGLARRAELDSRNRMLPERPNSCSWAFLASRTPSVQSR